MQKQNIKQISHSECTATNNTIFSAPKLIKLNKKIGYINNNTTPEYPHLTSLLIILITTK